MGKKVFVWWLSVVLLLISVCGCAKTEETDNVVKCYNGNFVGAVEEETGVLSFKGIPYAKAPVGELRWKAPEPTEESDETVQATAFGDSSLQYYWFSEPIQTEISEDCLTLNIWTDNNTATENKAVMVFFHGGSYAWGGSSEEIYNGQYIVQQHPDVVVVTVNYRIGMMGFIDFSDVPGGEDYADSTELGLLDCVEALRWIRNNIAAFGGNPECVTVFGESAGAGIVSCLLASEYAGELFQRVIAESGNLRMTYSEEQFKESYMTDALLSVSGAENMDDLLALSEEDLAGFNVTPLDEDDTTVNDLYNLPLRGGTVVKENAYDAVTAAAEKGVDLLIGTNSDEQNYWVEEMGSVPLTEMSEDEIKTNLSLFEDYYIGSMFESLTDSFSEEELEKVNAYLETRNEEDVWAKSKLFTETVYHQPAIRMAEKHSEGANGKTYMYYFEKANDNAEFFGSCHATELPYVFHNLHATAYGTVDEALADAVCAAWVNFAKTGNPSVDAFSWEEYDVQNRYTTVIGNDGTWTVVSDPEKTARELLSFAAEKDINPAGA